MNRNKGQIKVLRYLGKLWIETGSYQRAEILIFRKAMNRNKGCTVNVINARVFEIFHNQVSVTKFHTSLENSILNKYDGWNQSDDVRCLSPFTANGERLGTSRGRFSHELLTSSFISVGVKGRNGWNSDYFFSCFLDKRAWFYHWCLGAWSHCWWLV